MKINYFCFLFLICVIKVNSQNIGVNSSGATPNASALLDIDATGISPKLGLLIPRVTSAEKTAMNPLPAAAQGLVVYQTDGLEGFYYNTSIGTTPTWNYISPSSAGWSTSGNTLTGTLPGTPNEWIGTVNAADWIIKTGNTERIRVLSTGNIGIGTIAPTKSLQITGGASASLTYLLSLWSNCSTCGNLGTGTAIKFSNTNGANEDLGSVELTATRNVAGGNADFGIRLATNTPTMSERLRVTGVNGFVGINSSNTAPAVFAPTTALHIRERNTALNDLISLEKFDATTNQVAGIRFRVSNSATTSDDYKGAIYFERLNTAGRGSLHFATNNSATSATAVSPTDIRMSITSSGAVGINNQTPDASALLDISSTSLGLLIPRVALTASNVAGPITAPQTSLLIYNTASAGVSPNDVVPGYYYWNGTKWVSLSGGSSGNNWAITGNAGTTAGTNFIGTTDAVDLVFKTNNTEKARILSGGNVGIGITAPTQKLHVSGGSVLTDRAYAASTISIAANTVAFTTGANAATQIQITNNAVATANGNLTYVATAIEGQYLWITNNDAQSVPFASTSPATTIPAGKTMGFVYVGGLWEAINADDANALNWTTSGNAGTTAGTNFIGTTDSVAFVLKVNNHTAGKIGLLAAADTNTSFGNNALAKITGTSNVAIGALALQNSTSVNGSTAVGTQALQASTTGDNNTAIGYQTLKTVTTGTYNTALGNQALKLNTGSYNTALGALTLRENTSGGYNTAVGYRALTSNTIGYYNTGVGNYALFSNTSGYYNTGMGYNSLYNNINGNNNTAIGYYSMYSNLSGGNNTAVGKYSLYNDTTGSNNTAIGYQALYQDGTGKGNTAVGLGALYYNEVGDSNVAIGYNALRGATTGGTFNNNNVALGSAAGLNVSTGYNNVLVGNNSGRNLSTGYENVFFGNKSGYSNTSGANNLFYGNLAGYKNTIGDNNVFMGQQSGFANTNGFNNVFVGQESGYRNTTGYLNNFIGYAAGEQNIDGAANTFIGNLAGLNNTHGNFNTFIGEGAGEGIVSNNYNTAIGLYASFSGDYTNSTSVGYNTTVTASNQIRIGSLVTSIGGPAAWTNTSDGRVKNDIKENIPGLEFIKALRPVTFHYDTKKEYALLGKKDTTKYWEGKYDIEKITFSGFIAQEVDTAAQKIGYDFSGVDKSGTILGLRYTEFIPSIVKSIQEQQQMIDFLKKENAQYKTENTALKTDLQQLQSEIKEIQQQLNKLNALKTTVNSDTSVADKK